MAALDCALMKAIAGLPAKQAHDLKRTFGRVMGEIVETIINPAVQAFPELAPDESEWAGIVAEHATRLRANSGEATVDSPPAS